MGLKLATADALNFDLIIIHYYYYHHHHTT